MAQGLTKARPANEQTFAPEADGSFGVVEEREIADLREKMRIKYGVGQGRLVSLDDPVRSN